MEGGPPIGRLRPDAEGISKLGGNRLGLNAVKDGDRGLIRARRAPRCIRLFREAFPLQYVTKFLAGEPAARTGGGAACCFFMGRAAGDDGVISDGDVAQERISRGAL